MKTVDVVIISWAKDEVLRQVTMNGIDSLLKDESIAYNVYVVESNKDVNYEHYNDPSFHWGRKDFNVTTIHPDVPFGYHRYMNIGIRAGKSKYVAICNNDLTYESGWADNIIKLMELHPDILSASPWCPQTQGDNTQHKNKVYLGHRVRGELAGWCIFQQRKIYDTIEQLNEEVDFWYSDNIYADELQMRGIKHALLPTSVVNHHDGNLGKTGNSAIDDKTKMEYTNMQRGKYLIALDNLKNKLKGETSSTI